MTNINELAQIETVRDYRKFNKKSKIRLIIFVILWLISYLICTISLFFSKQFLIPIISFIILFISIYFLSLDLYKLRFRWAILSLFVLFLLETIFFIIFTWFSWYLVLELVLFHSSILILLFLLTWELKNRTDFSPFSYFTQWWFFIASLLTIFFCVLMMWKYTQIPFTCDDIESFPEKVVSTTVNPFKKTWNKFLWWFSKDKNENLNIPHLYVNENPLARSSDLASADLIENFFTNIRNSIQTETLDIKNQVSKSTCNYYISILQKIQKSWWIQIAAIILWYFLLVWVFKILLWVVSIIWFMLFIVLRIFRVYKYEKKLVEKEVII